MNATSTFNWNGPAVQAQVMARVNQELQAMGTFLVSHMQAMAPVDTGYLRSAIYDVLDPVVHTLTVYSPAFYSIYQEFGTRFIRPHPYIRPAILEALKHWQFAKVELILRPPMQKSEPLIATRSGFRLPKHQKLTEKQKEHVKKYLVPKSRGYARRFKRAGTELVVRKFD
jgi:HK97 gp10 family phage protein